MSVCGVGYIGEGEYKSVVDYRMTPQYRAWSNMLQSKRFKEALIKQIAEKYKSDIPIQLHYALMNYEIADII